MEALGQYGLRVICACLICAMVPLLFQEEVLKQPLKILCGLFLAIAILSPLTRLDPDRLLESILPTMADSEALVRQGQDMTADAIAERIQVETEAYILDKAAVLGADISVHVGLSSDSTPAPETVTISGHISTEGKQYLEVMLEEDLGISKEDQRWIG